MVLWNHKTGKEYVEFDDQVIVTGNEVVQNKDGTLDISHAPLDGADGHAGEHELGCPLAPHIRGTPEWQRSAALHLEPEPKPELTKTKPKKPSLLDAWEASAEDREIIRDLVLEEYFALASGANILKRIHAAKRNDTVITDFLDALGVEGMRKAMSPEFGEQIRTKLAPKKPKPIQHAVQTGTDENNKPIFALQGRNGSRH